MNKNKKHAKNIIQIQDFEEFLTFVQNNALQVAVAQLSLNPTVLKNLPDILDGCLTHDKIFFQINRFVFSKRSENVDFTSEDLYINNTDISRVIFLIANDIISFTLNKLVDQKKLYMCWDKKVNDFLWLEKIK